MIQRMIVSNSFKVFSLLTRIGGRRKIETSLSPISGMIIKLTHTPPERKKILKCVELKFSFFCNILSCDVKPC